jgi:choline kinase
MKAIIIGAGRGIRLMPETEYTPKCMLGGVGERRVLDWILDSLEYAGIDDVIFIGGHQMSVVEQAYSGYSDIVYKRNVAHQLMASNAEVALVVDRDWQKSYIGRTLHPESQAEKVVVEDGRIVKIGKHLPSEGAHGEFIGLAKFDQKAAQLMRDHYHKIRDDYLTRPFQTAKNIRVAYLTDMLQEMIDLGVRVESVDIRGDWIELDTPQDLERGRRQWEPPK